MARLGRSQPFKPKTQTPPRIGVYSATCAVANTGAISSSVATFDPPVFSGIAALTVDNISCLVSTTFDSPVFSATCDVANTGVTCVVIGTVTQPTFSSTVVLVHSGAVSTSTTTFDSPVFSSSVIVANSGATCVVSGTVTQPIYSANAEVGLLSKHLQDLLCFSGTPTQAQLLQFVTDFNALIVDSSGLTAPELNFLDQDTLDGVLTYEDRDYWLTMIGLKYLAPTGRTFGIAAPSNLAEADPLNLRLDTAGVLRTDVIILDPQGANENITQTDAPVKITPATNNCTTPLGVAKSPAGLFSTTGSVYRYQFWTRILDLHESRGSGGRVRFLDAGTGITSKVITCYIRYSTQHVLDTEIELGKRPDGTGSHALKILIRGYPTDKTPYIPCGNSITGVNNDITTETEMISIGELGVSQSRRNMIWSDLHLSGKRDGIFGTGSSQVSGKIFAQTVMKFYAGSINNKLKRFSITDTQPIPANHAQAGSFPDYIDIAHDGRVSPEYNALQCTANNLILDRCHIHPADDDLPLPFIVDDTGYLGINITIEGADCQVINSRLDGRSIRAQIRLLGATRAYIAGNYISSANYKYVFCTKNESTGIATTDTIIERNFCVGNGVISDQAGEGIDIGEGSNGNVARYNTIYTLGTITAGTTGISISDAPIKNGTVISSGNSTGFLTFTVSTGHTIPIGYRLVVLGHSVSAYNVGHTVIGVVGDVIKTDTTYTSSGSGGTWQSYRITSDISVYSNIVYGVGVTIGYQSGWAIPPENEHDQYAKTFRNISIRQNLIHGFPSANSAATAAPIRVKLDGTLQADLGNLLENNNVTRDSGTTALLVRTSHTTADPYTVGDTLAGWETNTATDPQFANPAIGDFTLPVASAFRVWFPVNMPYKEADLSAWDENSLDWLCPLDLGIFGTVVTTFTAPVFTGTAAPANTGAIGELTGTNTPPTFSSTITVANTGASSVSIAVYADVMYQATASVTVNNIGVAVINTFIPLELPSDPTIYSALYNAFDISI